MAGILDPDQGGSWEPDWLPDWLRRTPRPYPDRFANNPVGTSEIPAELTPRSWWQDTKDAVVRAVTDPKEAAKMAVGVNPAANIALGTTDVAQGTASMFNALRKGDIEGTRPGALQVGLGGLAMIPLAGGMVRKVAPEARAAVAAARGAADAVEPSVARTVARAAPPLEVPPAPGAVPPPRMPFESFGPRSVPDAPPSAAALPAAPPAPAPAPRITLPEEDLFDPVTGAAASRGATQGVSPADYKARMENRKGLLDSGVSALNRVSPKGERGMAAIPSLRAMTPEEAGKVARGEPHLIQRPDGTYVGAPHWLRGPEDIAKMRAEFDRMVEKGTGGSDWYDRVHSYINEVSGGDPVKARQLAEEFAIFSAQADPTTNLGFAMQARNARVRGEPADKVRTGQQASAFNEARDAQEEYLRSLEPGSNAPKPRNGAKIPSAREGKKIGIYRQHMDPTATKGTTGTNDIWHARVFGYVDPKTGKPWDKALGEAQHTFLDYETMLAVDRANARNLGGRSNWTAAEIQAAPWVAAKSESLQKRYDISPAEGDKRATATYPDAAPLHTASMPLEQVPAASSGYTTGSMTPDEWQAAGRRVNAAGLDPTLEHLGFAQRRVEPATGAWRENGGPVEHNPADVSRPMIDFKTIDKVRTPHPGTMAGLESVAAVRGLSDMQAGTPATHWNTRAGSNKMRDITIDLGRGVSHEEASALNALGEKHGLTFANRGEGAGFLNFNEKAFPTGKEVKKALADGLEAEIRAIVPDARVGRAASSGPYVDYGDKISFANRGQGQATRHMDEILQRNEAAAPGIYKGLLDDPNEAVKAQQNLARIHASGQAGVRPDYELWQRLIAEGRLRQALEWARANGYKGLPVAAGGVALGGGILDADNSSRGGS